MRRCNIDSVHVRCKVRALTGFLFLRKLGNGYHKTCTDLPIVFDGVYVLLFNVLMLVLSEQRKDTRILYVGEMLDVFCYLQK